MTDQSQIISPAVLPIRPTVARSNRPEWLSRWLQGETPDAAILEQVGLHPSQFYAIVIYRPTQAFTLAHNIHTAAQFAAIVQSEAARRGINAPVMPHEPMSAVMFHPIEDPQQTTRLKRKTEEIRTLLAARFGDMPIACGVGRPTSGMDSLRKSYTEADQAIRVAQELNMGARATFFGNASLFSLLRSLKNPSELAEFCNEWLQDLITYDSRQHSELLETLRAYFANNGNTALTAKELRIHRNTLAYRLTRIAEITHLDLEDADVRLNLHLALKAYEVLTAPLQTAD
ncbi:MAG: hypothetical protein OHK0023_07260 [Anaerolineae bacterium]